MLLNVGFNVTYHQGVSVLYSYLKSKGCNINFIEVDSINDQLYDQILRISPSLIGLSVNTHMIGNAIDITKKIKKLAPNIPLFVGGIHPTLNPSCINDLFVDGICIGEGEYAFAELVNKIDNNEKYINVKNFWFKKNNRIIKNNQRELIKNLDDLPDPDYLIFRKYKKPRFIFTRGCPFGCSYCCNNALIKKFKGLGQYVRFQSVEKSINQIIKITEKIDFKHFVIDDDTFTLNKKWVIDFCKKMMNINKTFECNVRIETVDSEILKWLKKAGCEMIKVGIESGDEDIRKNILNRHMTNQKIIETFNAAKKFGLKTFSFNMVGIPEESEKNIMKTVELNRQIQPDKVQVSIFYPYPGTDLGDYCVKQGYITNKSYNSYFDNSILELPTISKEKIEYYAANFNDLVYGKKFEI